MRKVLVSGMIGNGLEWYDYALFGQMAPIIRAHFFPSADPTAGWLATFGVFAVGFFFRPLGAVLFGYLGDRFGRRVSLAVAILMMAIPTGCIGLLPTYHEIGIWAPILLTLIRMFQGLSLGGEFSGSITYIVEHAPPHRRGLAGSMSLVSLILGFMLGSLVGWIFSAFLSEEDFRSWGWRVPFLIGIVIGLVGLYIRSHCEESPTYENAKRDGHLSDTPVREAFAKHPWEMLQAFGIYISVTMPFYLTTVYFISFSVNHLGVAMKDSLFLNLLVMLALLVTMPASAWLSDRIGRRKIMIAMALLMLVSVLPLFGLFDTRALFWIGLAQVLVAVILGLYIGPVAAILVELFPTSVRYSGMAISYNLAAAGFGGTAPFVCEWLIKVSGGYMAIAYYVMLCNVVSLVALRFYRERYKEALA